MARKKAQTEAPKASPTASAAANKTLNLITERQLKSLLTEDDNYKTKIDGFTGELREAIGNAVEKKHLHKGAYAMVKKLHRMKSNEQLSDLWHQFLAYVEMSGVMKRIDSVSALPLDGEDEGEGETTGEDEGESPSIAEGAEVTRPQFGRGARATH